MEEGRNLEMADVEEIQELDYLLDLVMEVAVEVEDRIAREVQEMRDL